ncbi:MAG TPA: integrase [Gammaproteobacteria bacterium]|nr:integrase [Gammaproteobacteria bacterium]
MRIYERHTANAGLSKMHGLRHAYAQQRYEEMTGWPSPAAGGPTVKELTIEQKREDQNARQVISRQLGHERSQVVGIYLGK